MKSSRHVFLQTSSRCGYSSRALKFHLMKKSLLLTSALLLVVAGCSSSPATDDGSTAVDYNDYNGTVEEAETIAYESEYGFTMAFPKNWEGYTTEEKDAQFNGFTAPVIYFRTAEGLDLFALSIFTPEQWEQEQEEEGPKPEKLGETAEYVIGYNHTQDSTGLESYDLDFDAVRASFQVL